MNHKERRPIEKIRNDVVKIICNSKATFFVNEKNKNVEIPPDELLYELKAEICTNVETYFYNLLKS